MKNLSWVPGLAASLILTPVLCGAQAAPAGDASNFNAAAGQVEQTIQQDKATAASSAQASAASAPSPYPIGNFALVQTGIYRGAELKNEADYAYLQTLGVTEVVNLRELEKDSSKYCAKYGLDCRQFPIALSIPYTDRDFNYDELQKAFAFVLQERAAGKEVYFHCEAGSDRTGALAAALAIRQSACGAAYDKDQLWSQVDTTLQAHHFHRIYPFLHKTIQDWVYDLGDYPWICR